MNWKCKLGFHKWFIIKSKNKFDLEHEIESIIYYNIKGLSTCSADGSPRIHDKICERCFKIENNIETFIKEYMKKLYLNLK